MKLIKDAQAGTFESSDVVILIEPVEENTGRQIEINSNVEMQYGEQIKKCITEILDEYEITDIHLIAKDKGALDATVKARVETALKRAMNIQEGTLS